MSKREGQRPGAANRPRGRLRFERLKLVGIALSGAVAAASGLVSVLDWAGITSATLFDLDVERTWVVLTLVALLGGLVLVVAWPGRDDAPSTETGATAVASGLAMPKAGGVQVGGREESVDDQGRARRHEGPRTGCITVQVTISLGLVGLVAGVWLLGMSGRLNHLASFPRDERTPPMISAPTAMAVPATATSVPSPTTSPEPTATLSAQRDSRVIIDEVVPAVVVVVAEEAGTPIATASGTIVSPDGLIATSHAITEVGAPNANVRYLVLATEDPSELPVPAFTAEVVRGSPELGLAVLRVAGDHEGQPIDAGDELDLPWVALAEPTDVALGDNIHIVGYPDLGSDPVITVFAGRVTGFVPDPEAPELGSVGWIMTDSAVPGTVGGAAVDDEGQLVGIPLEAGRLRPAAAYVALLARGSPASVQQQPTDAAITSESIDGATVTGKLVSADTGEPIDGGQFIVLEPGVRVADYMGNTTDSDVFAVGVSDERGAFHLPEPVERGQAYGVVIIASGFETLARDGMVLATADDPATVDLGEISMSPE